MLPVTVVQGNGKDASVGAAAEMGARLAGADGGGYGATTTSSSSSARERKKSRGKKRPRFLILDFRRVTAVDMSSVVNCWLPLQSLCRDMGVVLVYAHCNLRVRLCVCVSACVYVRKYHLYDRPTD